MPRWRGCPSGWSRWNAPRRCRCRWASSRSWASRPIRCGRGSRRWASARCSANWGRSRSLPRPWRRCPTIRRSSTRRTRRSSTSPRSTAGSRTRRRRASSRSIPRRRISTRCVPSWSASASPPPRGGPAMSRSGISARAKDCSPRCRTSFRARWCWNGSRRCSPIRRCSRSGRTSNTTCSCWRVPASRSRRTTIPCCSATISMPAARATAWTICARPTSRTRRSPSRTSAAAARTR